LEDEMGIFSSLFRRQAKSVFLTRCYITHKCDTAAEFIRRLMESIDQPAWIERGRYSYNYRERALSYENLIERLRRTSSGELEHLMVDAFAIKADGSANTDSDRPGFDLCASVGKLANGEYYWEIFWMNQEEQKPDQVAAALKRISAWADVHYAYGRALREDREFGMESDIQRGLFGGGITVKPPAEYWWLHPMNFDEGSVRGIYPINYWPANALAAIRSSKIWLPDLVDSQDCLYAFTNEQQQEIVRRNPDIRKFIHFSADD
jgi:hypothetical protein